MNAIEIIEQRIKLLSQWRHEKVDTIRNSRVSAIHRDMLETIMKYDYAIQELRTILENIKAGRL
jgi:hypothetical protein